MRGAGVSVADNGAIGTHAESARARGIAGEDFSAEAFDARGVVTEHAGGAHDVRLRDAELKAAEARSGRFGATLAEGHVEQAHAHVGAEGAVKAEANKLGGQGLAFDVAGRDLKDEASTGGGYVSTGQVVRGLAPRVDAVDATFSAPMRPGKLGSLGVDQGTRLDAEVHARDNKLVPGQTGVEFSKPLDAPAWIGVNGVALREHRPVTRVERGAGGRGAPIQRHGAPAADQGKVEADVSGWFDQDVTGRVNKELGRKDASTVPLSIAELGGLTADRIDATRDETRTPGKDKPAAPSPLDMSGYAVDARVALSPGQVDLGDRQHVEVARAGKGGNELNVRGRGGEALVIDMLQVVLGSMNLQVGGKKVESDSTQLSEAQVKVAEDGQRATTFQGSIGAFSTEGLKVE